MYSKVHYEVYWQHASDIIIWCYLKNCIAVSVAILNILSRDVQNVFETSKTEPSPFVYSFHTPLYINYVRGCDGRTKCQSRNLYHLLNIFKNYLNQWCKGVDDQTYLLGEGTGQEGTVGHQVAHRCAGNWNLDPAAPWDSV